MKLNDMETRILIESIQYCLTYEWSTIDYDAGRRDSATWIAQSIAELIDDTEQRHSFIEACELTTKGAY